MKAITVIPKKTGTLSLREVEVPALKKDQVLVRVLEAGVCGTDLEINAGLYGEPPTGSDYLILGHECLGRVVAVGEETKGVSIDDYVTRTVRRPCADDCPNCASGNVDMCSTGNYTETGIKGLQGDMCEYFAEVPGYLVQVPYNLCNIGVLMEPMSVAEKAVQQSLRIQERMNWDPKKALVVGAGPIGLLSALILRLRGLDVYVCARSAPGNLKSQIVEKIGATYLQVDETKPTAQQRICDAKFDLIVEASGSAARVNDSFYLLNTNGVLCLTSVTGGNYSTDFPIEKINIEMVLGNKLVFGIVNASHQDYRAGVRDFERMNQLWPGIAQQLITRRLKPEQYLGAFEKKSEDIKTIIEF